MEDVFGALTWVRHKLTHLVDLHILRRERLVVMIVVEIMGVLQIAFDHGAIFVVVRIAQDVLNF